MDPKKDKTQESELAETTETNISEAEQAQSPGQTDGVSSSDTEVTEDQSEVSAEQIRNEWLEKYGDKTPEEASEEDADDGKTPDEKKPDASRKEEPTPAETDDADDEHRLSDEDFKKLPEGVRKRIGTLNTRAKRAEKQVATLTTQVEEGADAAKRMSDLRTFAEQSQMTAEDVANGLGIMAKLTTGDYEGFLTAIAPFLEQARLAAGQAIAPDLQSQVDDGFLTEEAAKQLTRARLQAERATQEAQRERQRSTALQETQTRQVTTQQILTAVNAREAELRGSDPDYARKSPAIKRYMEGVLKRGAEQFKTVEDVIGLVNEAYEFAQASAPAPTAPTTRKATPPRPSATTPARGTPNPANLTELFEAVPPN